jgi:hypothetical protein
MHLTGRRTQRKQLKESNYSAQVALMQAGVEAKANDLWGGECRTSFTKRMQMQIAAAVQI